MNKSFKTWFGLAAGFLLLSFLGHSLGHYTSYLNESGFDAERMVWVTTMKNYSTQKIAIETSAWTMMSMYSLSLALQYLFGGLINFLLLKSEIPPAALRKIAGFNSTFWGITFLLVLVLNPVIQPLIISLTACLLFGMAFWKSEGKNNLRNKL